MKARRATPVRELGGDIAHTFNLASQYTGDGWRVQDERDQSAADRAQAAARQMDMFPDAEGPRRKAYA